jgi:hypothetical protein
LKSALWRTWRHKTLVSSLKIPQSFAPPKGGISVEITLVWHQEVQGGSELGAVAKEFGTQEAISSKSTPPK